jgi:hypothetical protein
VVALPVCLVSPDALLSLAAPGGVLTRRHPELIATVRQFVPFD